MARLLATFFVFLPVFSLLGEELKIGFGSCYYQDYSSRIWETLKKEQLDYFIFLGDNVYADAEKEMELAYRKLFRNTSFQEFRKRTEILAIWDDHDFGANDAGKEFPGKTKAKELFLRYWYQDKNRSLFDEISSREGVYHSYRISGNHFTVLVILPDTRWFRDPLEKETGFKKGYVPTKDETTTILGKEQWDWLQKELKKNADLVILASSIQVIPEEHPFEKWANFPHERKKLLELIAESNIPIIIFSGDRHFAEISKIELTGKNKNTVTVYEITSSSLNQELPDIYKENIKNEKNKYRIAGPFFTPNFGFLSISMNDRKMKISAGIKDDRGNVKYKFVL